MRTNTEDRIKRRGVVIHGSCENMRLADDEVSLTVTSPPYWNAVDYSAHLDGEWYRDPQFYQGYKEYMTEMSRCFVQVFRVTKPGGFCAIVVGTILHKGKHFPLHFHFASMMEQIGWEFREDITWYKVTGGVKRARVMIQHPRPGYYYPNIMTERILIYSKPGPPIYEDRDGAVVLDMLWKKEIANDIWHIAPVPPNTIDHPTAFPEEIPWRLIELYSYPGDLVLDPFCGSGTTLKVAKHLGRRWVGYDTSPEYVVMSRARVKEKLVRRKQIQCSFGHFEEE